MTMGTASTMASMVEALGVGCRSNAAIPAVDARRNALARMAGRRIVEMVQRGSSAVEDPDPRGLRERDPHARAPSAARPTPWSTCSRSRGRIGVDLTLDDCDRLGRGVHCLVDLMPSGKFLMEDFYYAGGLPAVLRELGEHGLLNKDALTVNGRTIWENVKDAPCWNREVITPFDQPFKPDAGIAVLRGNLAPDGAVIKPSAASPRADEAHAAARWCSRPSRSCTTPHRRRQPRHRRDLHHGAEELRPEGLSGHGRGRQHAAAAEAAARGRDATWSASPTRACRGTAYGTVVLHVAPEAAAGGPLALVRNGDLITLDVAARRLHLHVDDAELARRRARWHRRPSRAARGYAKLYVDHVLQADRGADLDFLVGKERRAVRRDNH